MEESNQIEKTELESIIGIKQVKDPLTFYVRYKEQNTISTLTSQQLRQQFPEKLVDYYEKQMIFIKQKKKSKHTKNKTKLN